MVTAGQYAELQRALGALSRSAEAELRSLAASLSSAPPEQARDVLLEAMPAVSDAYGTAAGAVAAEWYDDVRASEGVSGRYRAQPAAPASLGAVRGSVGALAGELWADRLTALNLIIGAGVRHVMMPARRTVMDNSYRDPRSSGWQRVARPDGCDFCVMLAQRGAVYKRGTVDFAAHDNCTCGAVPRWDPDAPEVSVKAYEASERLEPVRRRAAAGDEAAQRRLERHRQTTRSWLKNYKYELDDYRKTAGLL